MRLGESFGVKFPVVNVYKVKIGDWEFGFLKCNTTIPLKVNWWFAYINFKF